MNRTLTISISTVALLLGGGRAYADWIYNPSTGHWYSLTATGLTWTQAEAAAVAAGGHLVSINDGAENSWILAEFGVVDLGMWIGLFQPSGSPEPAGGWEWTNGEPVTYLNWHAVEPNNTNGDEDVAVFAGTWNDVKSPPNLGPGVIERETCPPGAPCPTVSEWGLIVMTCLTLVAGTMILMRARRAPA